MTTILKESANKNDIKDSKKVEEFNRNKLLLLLSLFTGQKNFQSSQKDQKTIKAFSNVVEIIKKVAGDNKYSYVTILEDFYSLLPASSELKCDLLVVILESLNEDPSVYKSNKDRLSEILVDFNNFEFKKENYFKIYSILSKVLEQNKNFDLLKKKSVSSKIALLISHNLTEVQSFIGLDKLYFFILFNKFSIENFSANLTNLNSFFNSLSNESKVVQSIINSNLQIVKDLDANYFINTYGNSNGKFILFYYNR